VLVVRGDVRGPSTLPAVVAECSAVVSAMHGMDPFKDGSPETIDRDGNANLVAVADVAGAVVRVVEDESLRGAVIHVGGPENLTLNRLADRVACEGCAYLICELQSSP
jgi:nucleoside-diphosphate-sugar epimerase